jgi:molybdopterin-binding protein
MLKLEGLSKTLGGFVLHEVSFEVAEGDYFVLLGASGVGKTVLLELIAGLRRPDRGTVRLDGRDITGERIQRRRLGLVYQDQALFPHMSVRANIAYALRGRGLSRRDRARRVTELADETGVGALLDRRPGGLSGGESQRVALARCLAVEPRCFLLDEPLSSLDAGARRDQRALLRRLNQAGHTMMHVTHDYEEALSVGSRVAVMDAGRIVQAGRPDEVFRHPRSEFVARFVGIRNCYHGRLEAGSPVPTFRTGGPVFHVLTDAASGPGFVIIRSEDVMLSPARARTSARNCLCGTIVDIAPARLGVEVSVDVGVEISALVTREAVESLGFRRGDEVWAEFKASAIRFVPD